MDDRQTVIGRLRDAGTCRQGQWRYAAAQADPQGGRADAWDLARVIAIGATQREANAAAASKTPGGGRQRNAHRLRKITIIGRASARLKLRQGQVGARFPGGGDLWR